jgi:hypothetical protein
MEVTMRRTLDLLVRTTLMLLALDVRSLSQSDEWDLDAESGAERSAKEELLDRLRRSPIDLSSATEADLLQIPGMQSREASSIIRAVRDGMVLEIRAVDLIPGVRRGTADKIAPYVFLRGPSAATKLDVRLRSIATLRGKDGDVGMMRSRSDIRVDGSPDPTGGTPLRLEIRRSGVVASEWFSYVSIPVPFTGWSMALGDLDVRTGSALLDAGRRTSLVRPSEWERRLLSDARILPGYDEGTAQRGAAVQAASDERMLQASLSTDGRGRRTGTISWTEQWPFRLTTQVVRDLKSPRSSIRFAYGSPSVTISVEAGSEAKTASYVASFRWEQQGSLWIHSMVRLLRQVAAPGVPRVGRRDADESGAGLAMEHMLNRRFRWRVVGDVGRIRENGPSPGIASPSFTLGVGGVVQWEDRSRADVEWVRSLRDRNQVRRWSLLLTQRLSGRIHGALALAHRSESTQIHPSTAGKLAMARLSWSQAPFTAHARWTAGDGDPSVEFWSLAPGPSILDGLQRFAGRSGEVRGTVEWIPTRSVELGIAAALKYRPSKELRVSILLEIQL